MSVTSWRDGAKHEHIFGTNGFHHSFLLLLTGRSEFDVTKVQVKFLVNDVFVVSRDSSFGLLSKDHHIPEYMSASSDFNFLFNSQSHACQCDVALGIVEVDLGLAVFIREESVLGENSFKS